MYYQWKKQLKSLFASGKPQNNDKKSEKPLMEKQVKN